MPFGFRQLRYFLAIADAGALSRAAEALHVAQSALSHHVAELEAELGVKLLERRPRGIALTAAGRRLYEHAGSIVSALRQAETDVKTFTEAAVGPIAVGLSHTAIAAVSLPIMQMVRRECPQVHLSVVEGLSPTLTERILAGILDLAVVYNPSSDSRLACEPLLEEELYLVGREDVIGRASTPVTFAGIPRGSVLGLYPAPASRSIIAAQILRNQITPSPTLEIDSLNAMRKALEAGLGCAILARSTVASELSEGRIHARRIVQPAVTRTLNVIALAEHPKTRAFIEVRRIIAYVILDEVKNGNWPAKASSRRRKA